MDEAAGDRADAHENGYTLTDSGGGVGSAAGLVYANAAVFAEGVDDYFTRARADSALINFSSSTAFTMAYWIYPTSFAGGPDAPNYYKTWASFNGASSFTGGWYIMSTNAGQAYIQFGKTGGPPQFQWHTGLTCTLNGWQLVAVTHDSNAVVAYRNGSTTETTNAFAFTAATAGAFEVGIRSSNYNMDGRMGPVAMWNRALSVAELDLFYNGGAGIAYADLP